MPPELAASAVRVVVHRDATPAAPGSAETRYTVTLRPGVPMSDVAAAVDAANPGARLIEIGVEDVRRLCKWLGSSAANIAFNRVQRYALTESARFCPSEDHRTEVRQMHTHAHTHARTYTHTRAHTRAHTHAHAHTGTHTHADTHARTHTRTCQTTRPTSTGLERAHPYASSGV